MQLEVKSEGISRGSERGASVKNWIKLRRTQLNIPRHFNALTAGCLY